jgi:PAS domain S-box-containing protein
VEVHLQLQKIHNEPVFAAIILDISERKQAQAVLLSERERLSGIIEGTNVGTWEWNIQTGETIFNERWAEIIGYTLDEISPTTIDTWSKFVHPEDLKKSNELIQKHMNGELEYYE